MKIESQAPEALKQLAEDIFHGLVFTDRHIQNSNDFTMVFMLFALIDGEQLKELQEANPGMIYEYLSEANPRSCNGYPSFFSAKYLNQEDAAKVTEAVKAMKTAVQSVTL